ncbi:MAG TPA: DEAD/DEAH box helicase [Rubneribacter badeniensis]|uniref:DEAD/DEAH box helicase n=1 Tax=Rubneribacter badeniensis TaxID=2070688 RepID=A0A9D2VLR4_9ACTN|nr:DEAD/DEAH box helicase [Rubneribacter badeniensis]
MAKPFSSSDARRLVNRARQLYARLDAVGKTEEMLRGAVGNAVNAYISSELMRALSNISVDELNRDKSGIRIGALKNARIYTIADVCATSFHSLSSIYGISEKSADVIKRKAEQYARDTQQNLKVKLTVDEKTPASTEVVRSLHCYKEAIPHIEACRKLSGFKRDEFRYAERSLKVGINGISWIFASRTKRARAEESYNWLRWLTEDSLGPQAEQQLSRIAEKGGASADAAWTDFSLNSVEFFNILEELAPGFFGTGDTLYGLPEDLAREIQDEEFFPDGLLCTLRRYQAWGVKYILHQKRVLLGDEMGLGKTVQAIATMVSLRNIGATHFIVICPASVLENWCREIRKHSRLRVTKIHGSGKINAFKEWQDAGGAAVTTYETTKALQLEDGFGLSLAVVDEAHYIKNPEAQRTCNTVHLCRHAERLLFMTGTALENKVDEMIALIRILQPVVANEARSVAFLSSAPQFREMIAPVYYRRKREDVLTELPDLIEKEEWCPLGAIEKEVYERSLLNSRKNFMTARQVSWNVSDPERHSSKAKRMIEIIHDAEEDGRKTIVFTFFRDVAEKVGKLMNDRCAGIINGSTPLAKRQEIIDGFDAAKAGSVLVCQIQSGGTGLNIQSASVIVICEPQLKPSIESQAISRAYRMGQTRNVLVFRLLCSGTIDERIRDLLDDKKRAFDAFADKSSAASAVAEEDIAVDDKSLHSIIIEEIERIKAENPELAAEVARQHEEL